MLRSLGKLNLNQGFVGILADVGACSALFDMASIVFFLSVCLR